MERRWLVFTAVSVMFFFITAATFKSLGVVLYTMAKELHWTEAEAGESFSVLGMACCLSSLVPMALVKRLGARWTYFIGALMLGAGFLLAFGTKALPPFLVATGLMGVGFSLCANIPGVYLLARWFPNKTGRIIGAYLMCGAFGGVVGPPLIQMVIAASGWRELWLIQALTVGLIGLACLASIRDEGDGAKAAGSSADDASDASGWTQESAIRTPQFILMAVAMVVLEGCVTVVQSSAVSHFTKLGMTPLFGAWMLGLQALMATIGKGASGTIGEWINPRFLLAGGIFLECIGMLLLSFANTPFVAYAFFLTFGLGWGTGYLAITVILIRYFGPRVGSLVLSFVWLVTVVSALGPAAAGMAADRFGSYSPAYLVGAALLVPIAILTLIVRAPRSKAGASISVAPARLAEEVS